MKNKTKMKNIYYGIKNKTLYLMLIINLILIVIGVLTYLLYDKTIGLLIIILFGGSEITLLEIWLQGIKFNSKDKVNNKWEY